MSTCLLTPEFFGMLEPSALELCDYFFLRNESLVPVSSFGITVNGERQEFVVKFDTYKPALLLLYLANLARSTTYPIGPAEQKLLVSYYGQALVKEARTGKSGHTLLSLLATEHAEIIIDLELKPGYVLPESKGRTLQEMIQYAWHCRETLEADSMSPLIRNAVHLYLEGERLHLLPVHDTNDPKVWPSRIWSARVREIATLIRYQPVQTAA